MGAGQDPADEPFLQLRDNRKIKKRGERGSAPLIPRAPALIEGGSQDLVSAV